MLFQRLIEVSAGRDIRYIVNGQAVAIVRTGPAGDFRSNIAGQRAARADPAEESLALSACRALGLHRRCGLLMARTVRWCEVNSNAHFAGCIG